MDNKWDLKSEYLLKPADIQGKFAVSCMKIYPSLDSILHANYSEGDIYTYKLPNGNVSAVMWSGSDWKTYFSDVKGLVYKGIEPNAEIMVHMIEDFYGVEIG